MPLSRETIESGTGVDIEIRDACPHELAVVATVLSRAMRDNPLHLSVFGPEQHERERKLKSFFGILLSWMPHPPWVGIHNGTIVAVCAMGEPGGCQPTFPQKLKIVRRLAQTCGVVSTSRALRWFGAWSLREPKEAHCVTSFPPLGVPGGHIPGSVRTDLENFPRRFRHRSAKR